MGLADRASDRSNSIGKIPMAFARQPVV